MTIIPFRTAQHVKTDQMADTEAASSIPPWPVDFGPRVEPEPEDCDGGMVGRLIAYAAIVVVSIGAVAAMLY